MPIIFAVGRDLEPDTDTNEPGQVGGHEVDPAPEQPTNGGNPDAELMPGQSDSMLLVDDASKAECDWERQAIAEDEEEGADGVHAYSMALFCQTPVMADEAIHDLGGRPGFGPVPLDDDAVFHDEWERRAFAVTQLAQVAAKFNTDAFRHGIEREDPELYLEIRYFDKWIRNGERMLVEGGVLAPDAVSSRLAGTVSTLDARRTTNATPSLSRGARREIDEIPPFGIGDQVRVRTDHPHTGHTRLPGYVAGRIGVVDLINDAWVYPDTHAHGEGEAPVWVYAVRFVSSDLWPADSGPGHAVYVDLFEPYLEHV
jgi:nitrile hydratase beta subunit